MTSYYWGQWDKDDLDSWQGKFWDDDEYAPDLDDNEGGEDHIECSCSNVCMDCLGLSWHDFV